MVIILNNFMAHGLFRKAPCCVGLHWVDITNTTFRVYDSNIRNVAKAFAQLDRSATIGEQRQQEIFNIPTATTTEQSGMADGDIT